MGKVILLTDGKAGHENQSKAFVRALGCEAEIVRVEFKHKALKAMSYLLDHLGIRSTALVSFATEPWLACCPVAVVGAGSGTFYAAKALAKKLAVKCAVVLYPRGYSLKGFDCILAPSFDRPATCAKVIELPVNLVANDAEFYAKGVEAFGERTSVKPELAVIVGGPNKCSTMTTTWMKAALDEIFRQPGVKAVTTSRRTPAEVEALIDGYPWDYKLIYSRDHFNPIPAFVKLAKRLYVTAESTGMLSEACTFGAAEVKVLDNLLPGPHKFRRFVEGLRAAGYVDGSRKVELTAQFAAARRLLGL